MENIRVLVRVRPLNYRETHLGASSCVQTSQNSIVLDNKKEYLYDYVLGIDSQQTQVYEKIGQQTLDSLINGLNCCVFAYGQTGAGKTYTMQGKGFDDVQGDGLHLGLQPRLIQQLFQTLPKDNSWSLKCTYLEIYNEQLIDLLNDGKPQPLTIREDAKRVYVENLNEVQVTSYNEILSLMQRGLSNRHVSATQMNLESSRSHSIFTLQLEQRTKGMYTRKSKLNFVDLAGSERQKLTAATGDRLKEAANINKSLTVLGIVINSLAESPKKFIPYRDSKLTFLLRESLGGNSKTFMIATISAASSSFQETLGTLKFASRAKNIKNQAIVNEEVGGNLDSLKAEIKRLKNELQSQTCQSEMVPKKHKDAELISQISTLSYQLNESNLYQDQLTKEIMQMKEYYESRITELTDHNIKTQDIFKNNRCDKDLELQQSLEIQKELRIKIETLNQKILELTQEDILLKHKRNEQQLLIAHLEQTLNEVTKDKEYLQEEAQKQDKLIQEYEQQLETLQEDKSNQLIELETKIFELSDQIQLNKDQMDTDQQTIEFQISEIEKLQFEIDSSKNQVDKFVSEKEQLQLLIQQKQNLIEDQLNELIRFRQRNEKKSKKFLKSLKLIKKQQECLCQLEQQQNNILQELNEKMVLEQQEPTVESVLDSVKLKFNSLEEQLNQYINLNNELSDQKNYYIQLYSQNQIELEQTIAQKQELLTQLEQNKINKEAIEKYDQLKDEFKLQKDKLTKFLDSFVIINQKLIIKENEVLKIKSELKLEQTQKGKILEELDKIRISKTELQNEKNELQQTIQQIQFQLQNETDEMKQKKINDNILALQKANQKLNCDLALTQRQYKLLQDEKDIMQKKYEERLMYSVDIARLRKDISITHQLKDQLDKKDRDFMQLNQETQILDDFFKKINVKRFCNYQIQNEGTISQKIKSYFEFLEQCEQEFEQKQYQLKTNSQMLQIEQANCTLIKEENRLLKMQLNM